MTCVDICLHILKISLLPFMLQSIPENGTPEAAPVVNSTCQSLPQAPSSVPTQNTSPPVQPSEGPASLSAEQVRDYIELMKTARTHTSFSRSICFHLDIEEPFKVWRQKMK